MCRITAEPFSDRFTIQSIIPDQTKEVLLLSSSSFALKPDIPTDQPRRFFSCGIINAKSGRCSEDCAFCAQSSYHSTHTPVHGLAPAEILYERASFLAENGVDRLGIVTSGCRPSDRDFDRLCEAAQRISSQVRIKLCASLGLLNAQQALKLKQAGFSRYHHNLETSRSFYPSICNTHAYDDRILTVRQAKDAGLSICSGGLFGLGESPDQRRELALTLARLDVDCIPVNFLMPIPGTPLENAEPLLADEALSIIALLRREHPLADIVICGGRSRTLGEKDREVFSAGATGIMVGDYLTAKGSPFERDMRLLAEMEENCG